MNARQTCTAIVGCVLACALQRGTQAAPTEYSTLYHSDPVSGESSGIGRFIYDPKTQRVSELAWDFGRGWTGALAESYPQDPALAPLLLNALDSGIATTVRLVPPQITGPFSAVQWHYLGFNPPTWFVFTRPQQPDLYGNLVSRKRRPEVHSIFIDHFRNSSAAPAWTATNEGWKSARSTYNYEAATAAELGIATLSSYESPDPAGASTAVLAEDAPYWLSARVLNRSANADARTGLVYSYQDERNFNELVFSSLGAVELREIRDGALATIASDAAEEVGQNLWVDVELRRAGGRSTAIVNGVRIFSDVVQSTLPAGRAGLVARGTHGTLARFDDVRIARPLSVQSFKETFDTPTPAGWVPLHGTWNVAGGTYVAPVQERATVLAPVRPQWDEVRTYGFRARILNPYGASGNLVGLTWGDGQYEVVFAPTGEVRVNRIDASGRAETFASGGSDATRNRWFEVEVCVERDEFAGIITNIYVNGEPLFLHLPGAHGSLGLVTHWSPGRFDDVAFRVTPFPRSYLQTFESEPAEAIVHSGSWRTSAAGVYESRAVGERDLVTFPAGADVDFVYRARLLNEYGAHGNWVGLVTNRNDDGDYYETLFSATGAVRVNKVVKGQAILQATARHTVRPNRWFAVELRRTGTRTAVKVNGRTILTNLPQGQVSGGFIGVVTHWSRAKFDDLSWQELK